MTTTLPNSNKSLAPLLQSPRFLPGLLLLFIGSGCAALIYEIVWLQLLQLVIGSSGISLGVLLGTFMGGMCLGSLVLPYIIPARWHPLRVYATLEVLIGVCGLGVLFGMPKVAEMYVSYAAHGTPSVWLRAGVAAICLVPPTLLMGATLPAVARWVKTTPAGVSWLGFFYGGNIAGAVFGCLLAGFYLLRLYNMNVATYVAAGINLAVAVIALILAEASAHERIIVNDDPDAPDDDLLPPERADGAGVVYLVIALSGLTALGAEVVWTRLLSLMLGATVYTFSIILAVFLLGLGIGSTLGAFVVCATPRPRLALGVCQMLIALSVGWAAFVVARSIPYWPIEPTLIGNLTNLPMKFPWYQFQLDLVRAAYAVLPGAILWGASFPLALASVAAPGQDSGRTVGGVYAANTVGAIVGSLAFSLYAIPVFGTLHSQQMIMVIAGVAGLLALMPALFQAPPAGAANQHDLEPTASVGGIVGVVLALSAIAALVLTLAPAPWQAIAFGRRIMNYMAQCDPGLYLTQAQEDKRDTKYSWYSTYVGEGMNVSVAVTKSGGYQYFHGAGKVQASTDPQDMRLQRMLGHLSVLMQKNPDDVRDILVVACGAGVTAGSFVPYPKIQNITICDIEPLVPTTVTPKFSSVNYAITDGITVETQEKNLGGKKVKVVFDDGRHYIRTLPPEAKFDVITSDPIDPWVKGCAALNTVEYYKMCRDHLKPGGVMSLWIPLYESNVDTAKSVIGTFLSVFPNGIVFSNDTPGGGGYDAVLFGTVDPPEINLDEVQKLVDRDEYRPVKDSIMYVGFGTNTSPGAEGESGSSAVFDMFATYASGGKDLDPWIKDAQINTDQNLRLQYLAGMWLNADQATTIFQQILGCYRFPAQVFVGSPEKVQSMKQSLENLGRREAAVAPPASAPTTAPAR